MAYAFKWTLADVRALTTLEYRAALRVMRRAVAPDDVDYDWDEV